MFFLRAVSVGCGLLALWSFAPLLAPPPSFHARLLPPPPRFTRRPHPAVCAVPCALHLLLCVPRVPHNHSVSPSPTQLTARPTHSAHSTASALLSYTHTHTHAAHHVGCHFPLPPLATAHTPAPPSNRASPLLSLSPFCTVFFPCQTPDTAPTHVHACPAAPHRSRHEQSPALRWCSLRSTPVRRRCRCVTLSCPLVPFQ